MNGDNKEGKQVVLTVDGCNAGHDSPAHIAGATAVSGGHIAGGARGEEMSESDTPLSFEEQMRRRLNEQERVNQEALLELGLPEVKTRKSQILPRHITEIIQNDPQSLAALIRYLTYVSDT